MELNIPMTYLLKNLKKENFRTLAYFPLSLEIMVRLWNYVIA